MNVIRKRVGCLMSVKRGRRSNSTEDGKPLKNLCACLSISSFQISAHYLEFNSIHAP